MISRSSTIRVAATKKPTSISTAPIAIANIAASRINSGSQRPRGRPRARLRSASGISPELRQRATELSLPPLQYQDVARREPAVGESRGGALPGATEREQVDLEILSQMQVSRRVADQQRVGRDHRLGGLQLIVLVARLQRGDFLGAEQLQLRLIHQRLERGRIALQHQDVASIKRPVPPRYIVVRLFADDARHCHFAVGKRLKLRDGLADQWGLLRQQRLAGVVLDGEALLRRSADRAGSSAAAASRC